MDGGEEQKLIGFTDKIILLGSCGKKGEGDKNKRMNAMKF